MSTVAITVRLPRPLVAKLDRRAKDAFRSRKAEVEAILAEKLESEKGRK